MRTITANVLAQMGQYSGLTPQDFTGDDTGRIVDGLCFYGTKLNGYAVVGRATITVELVDVDEVITAKVDQLKAELQKTQADSEVACNRIREQINSLLAIEYRETA